MLKRLFLIVLSIFSLLVVASCGEEYYEFFTPREEFSYAENNNYPLRLGVRYKKEYSYSNEIELYYGFSKMSNTLINDNVTFPNHYNYSDFNQEIKLSIKRLPGFYTKDSISLVSSEPEEVYSITDSLGNFLLKDKYIFSLDNEVTDRIDIGYIKEELDKGNEFITYFVEIKNPNDEYIKYIVSEIDEECNQVYDDDGNPILHNYFYPNSNYKDIKTLTSRFFNFKIVVRDDKFHMYLYCYS